MKFADMFQVGEMDVQQFPVDGDEVVSGLGTYKCAVCKEDTRFYSISFLAYYCSEECLKSEWDGFIEAYNQPYYKPEWRTDEEEDARWIGF
jgi:hypothetical protein